MKRTLFLTLLIQAVIQLSAQSCGVDTTNYCSDDGNYTDLATSFSDAITAYDQFFGSLSKILADLTDSSRKRIYTDKQVIMAVADFDTNVELAMNNSRAARDRGSSFDACLQAVQEVIRAKRNCYADMMTPTLVESAGVSDELKSVEKEFLSADKKNPEYADIRSQLRTMRSRKNELSYKIRYIEGEREKLSASMNATVDQRSKAQQVVFKLQSIQTKLETFQQKTSYICRPSGQWNLFSVKNLLEVEDLLDPMREIAKMISKFTGKPINSRLQFLTDSKIDALKHKFVKGNSSGGDRK